MSKFAKRFRTSVSVKTERISVKDFVNTGPVIPHYDLVVVTRCVKIELLLTGIRGVDSESVIIPVSTFVVETISFSLHITAKGTEATRHQLSKPTDYKTLKIQTLSLSKKRSTLRCTLMEITMNQQNKGGRGENLSRKRNSQTWNCQYTY